MGAAIRSRVDRLTGFDLSEGMLKRAAARGVYDRLAAGDVVGLMAAEPEDGFDLVLAADLLPYIGALAPLFAAVARVLSPGGAFAVSAERHDGDGYVLGEALRYRHAPAFVAATAESVGLAVLGVEAVSLRRERGVPVPGLIGLMVRPADIVPLTPRPAGPGPPSPRGLSRVSAAARRGIASTPRPAKISTMPASLSGPKRSPRISAADSVPEIGTSREKGAATAAG